MANSDHVCAPWSNTRYVCGTPAPFSAAAIWSVHQRVPISTSAGPASSDGAPTGAPSVRPGRPDAAPR
ncbi:Uncharacterised protein [Mycobacteroides abscessus subsp. abscessus]|nr:Uncharacterised protein [Mycobacteroides abscessus subsp. abscessus]